MISSPVVLEVLDQLVPETLHAEAWAVCNGSGWRFVKASNDGEPAPGWRMNLSEVAEVDAVWKAAKPLCERLAGRGLRVLRQYACASTDGQPGGTHPDDGRPGCFTLLYFPMPLWRPEWRGEATFLDGNGGLLRSVLPQPNQGVFLDSRIAHLDAAPSTGGAELRVVIVFHLEPAGEPGAGAGGRPAAGHGAGVGGVRWEEVVAERRGPVHTYRFRISAGEIAARTAARLVDIGGSLRIPGFRHGQIPMELLSERYGERAQEEVMLALHREVTDTLLAQGSLPLTLEDDASAAPGEVALRLTATHLPALQEPRPETWTLERWEADGSVVREAGVDPAQVERLLQERLTAQVLDRLDEDYVFPVAEILISRERQMLQRVVEASWNSAEVSPEERSALGEDLKGIAERRVRLGAVVAELARRHQLASATDPALESKVIAWLLAGANVTTRPATARDLLAFFGP
jgi:hypothetical protein